MHNQLNQINLNEVPEECQKFLPVLRAITELMAIAEPRTTTKLPKKKNVILSIDGPCASGKTTLSGFLKETLSCNVFHMDDFFLQEFQRTGERLQTPGENVDHERFLQEVLMPLKAGETVEYRRFDCHSLKILPGVSIPFSEISVVEGSYSQHELLREHYDLRVYLDISDELQKERILKRNPPEGAEMFFRKWIPLENAYFEKFRIKDRADLVIRI